RPARRRARTQALPPGRRTPGTGGPGPRLRSLDARGVRALGGDTRGGGVRLVTGFLGALSDAWAEIRVHKLRVLLSLIGIAVSVGALTAVVAISEYQRQFQAEQSDRWGGRAATIVVAASTADGTPVDADDFDARFSRVSERFGFSHTARIAQGVMLDAQLPEGVTPVPARIMDPAYSQIHREQLLEGRWFLDS